MAVDAKYIDMLQEKQATVDELSHALGTERAARSAAESACAQARTQDANHSLSAHHADAQTALWRDRSRSLAEQVSSLQEQLCNARGNTGKDMSQRSNVAREGLTLKNTDITVAKAETQDEARKEEQIIVNDGPDGAITFAAMPPTAA